MATTFKKPNKKTTIALVVAIVILLIIAVTGTVAFLKDRGSTEAADLEKTQQDLSQTEEAGNPEQNGNSEQEENQEQGESPEQTEIVNPENGEQTQGNQETTTVTGANNQNNRNTTQTDNIQETTIERVENVEIPERQISEGHYVGWTPMGLKAIDISSKFNVNDSKDIEISKQSVTSSGKNVVTRGEEITYTIFVKNISNKDITDIEVKDKIPEMTTYVEASADNSAREVVENKKVIGLIWNLDLLKAGEEKTLSFKVTVNNDATGVISNIAFANGEETEPVKNTIIEATKTVTIEDKENKTIAKVGDKLIYTITVKNTGNIAGTANVQDTKLKELIDNGILKVDEESQEIANKLMEGTTIDVPENAETTISFKVEILKVDGNITNIAVVGEEKPEVIIDTANIEIKKDVKEIIRNGEKVEGPVKVNDVINYEIVVSNTGSATAKVNVIDEIQNSNKKLDLKDENGKVVTEITVEGKSQRILTATYTVMQEDINKQEEILNVAKAIYDGDEKKDDAKTLVEEEKKDVIVEKLVTGKTKNVNLKAVKKDDVLVYSVKVTNNGNTTIDKVTITDEMLGIENKEYTFKAINPGESTIIELGEYTVTQEDINAQKAIKNIVLVNDKQDDVETPVETVTPKVEIEKTISAIKVNGATTTFDEETLISGIKVQIGNIVTYKIEAINKGNSTLSNVQITDNKDVVLVSAQLPERLSNVTITTGNKIAKNNNLLGTNNITLEPGEKITLTVSYTMLKSDVTGTNYQKDFVNTAYVTGEFNKTKYDDNDDATIQTEFIPSTGSKTFVKVWNDKNYESCRPKTITIQLMNGTIKVQDEITISATENWSYTWNNIPLEDTSGNMISYTVVEKEIPGYTASACTTNSKGQLTITNSYKKPVSKEGQIIKTINKETSTEIKVPIDVVFIVDTSGSMETNSRATSMVNAVNSAATQILNYNEYNRISVVGYSGTWNDGKNTTDSTVLLPLDRYTAKKSSNNINQYLKINGNTISTNVTGKVNNTRYVDGGTYTQIGIKDGANQLISSTNKTVTINGKEVKRTPVIILLSDGEPTLYTSNYNNVTSQNRMGGGDFASAEMGYYTILSANYYKNQVSTTYGKTAKMYTIGMDMSGIYGKSVLNPTINNITNLCKNSTEVDEYGYNAAKNLYNCFANSKCGFGSVEAVWNEWEWKWEYRLNMKEQNVTKNPYSNYSYADDSYVGAMNAQQLEDTMKDIITDVIPNTETWAISTSEIDSAKALLPGLDINGAFSFKVGTAINYTNCSETIAAGIIAGNEEEGYYIDLTKVPAGSTITVSYTAK